MSSSKQPSKAVEELLETAEVSKPKSIRKRIAPAAQERTRSQVATENEKYGRPSTIRLYDTTWQAVANAAQQHGVSKRQLHEFLLLAGLRLLELKRIDLPIRQRDDERGVVVDLPEPPKAYLEPIDT